MPNGVASNFQAGHPYPIYLSHAKGAHVWDVDGLDYRDFHGGFGVNVVGHAHPKIVEAVTVAVSHGSHFAAPTEEGVLFAEELCRRFGLEQVRFGNSGTEATMSAIRVARAATGRDDIVKIEGSYHGHHDAVMFSVVPNADLMGGREAPASEPMSLGVPRYLRGHTHVVPFNDLVVLGKLLDEIGDTIACLIIEPVMMNIGIAEPEPGYLAGLRDLLHRHGVLLIFDEVKSGATIAAGGAIERYGVQPDLACFAKAIGGGTPAAAFGGRADVMEVIGRGAAHQGTFNGNPLVCAAGLATLTEVLTPDAYIHLAALGTRLAQGCADALAAYGIPAHTVDLGAKGCVSYRPERLRNYRDFLEANTDLYAASYPWMVNRGLFMTPGDEEQWTLSVQHTDTDVDRYVDAFAELCAALV
jgi:glutamate-1-semialdehyde 2,1-aminomutase